MEKLISDNTVAPYVYPRLLLRHARQLREGPGPRILYHAQTHEIYTYTYFRNTRLSVTSAIAVDGMHGHAVGALDLGDVCLQHPVGEDCFFGMLRFVPMPFLFVPDARLSETAGFCRGAFSFESAGKKGILADMEFAVSVGVDFIGADHLLRDGVAVYYVGFVYDESL